MIRVRCYRCKTELDAPGAILLSPRDMEDYAVKKHFCVRCFGIAFTTIDQFRGCCDAKRGALLLSPPDKDDRVRVSRLCARHYQAALKAVDLSLRGAR